MLVIIIPAFNEKYTVEG